MNGVGDPALTLQWLRSLLWCGFDPPEACVALKKKKGKNNVGISQRLGILLVQLQKISE